MRVAVAYSGGRDSTALLHATARAALDTGVQVVGLHVHHGLSPHADAWLTHCRQQVEGWAAAGLPVSFMFRRLPGKPAKGESIEAWARDARYRALEEMAEEQGAALVLLAHHRRDQAETFVLQALRGAGMAGLSAMPESVARSGLVWARPWLNAGREQVEAYLQAHQLSFIDDDSNSDPRYARNRLRLQVWPKLLEAFPQAESSLATSAAWAQEALALQLELAEFDLDQVCDEKLALRLGDWQKLSPARCSNALRAWIQRSSGQAAPASLVQRLMAELGQALAPAAWPHGDGELRRYRGRLRFMAAASIASSEAPATDMSISRAGRYRLAGWGGVLQVQAVKQGGVPLARLAQLQIRPRQGGEQFQRAPASTARSLKKCFQEAAVPAWEREGPLLFAGDQLLYVPGLGVDARVWGTGGERIMSLRWLPDSNAKA
ncbi:tRNA lysidine(34) synthetase TilS [Roseateles toxinivorans]|uniref:tRNA(Ile)-lysidine synthase n=1 Tax=Roseateles toxinivorans TaxID=270368 RepID=A0A4R6QSW0_9BURK|nr:tRNA lysidine(34) synthetase TilS [Roseateles toxinivorans]TDP74447.1 tRNA(Ile)-lysidine synthase [Roseateles toxinivorans]